MTASLDELLSQAKKSPAYLEQERRLIRLQEGFGVGLAAVWLMASRSWDQVENSLSFAFTHDAFQAMSAVTFLASEGCHSPARRELRDLLESMAKHAYVDLLCPRTPVAERIVYLERNVTRSSVDFIIELPLFGLGAEDEVEFRASILSHYADLSSYVHRSPRQLREELRRLRTGAPAPKLMAADLERFNRLCFAVYDVAIFLQMQVLGPGLSGDSFVNGLDNVGHWPFHRGKFVRRLSTFFNYKHERQSRPTAG